MKNKTSKTAKPRPLNKHGVSCRTLIKAQVEFKVNDRPVSFAVIIANKILANGRVLMQ